MGNNFLQRFADETIDTTESTADNTVSTEVNADDFADTSSSDETNVAETVENDTQQPYKVFNSQDEYQSYFDSLIGSRLKKTREKTERLEKLDPVISILKDQYQVATDDELSEILQNEIAEKKAFEQGIPVDFYKENLTNKQKIKQYEQIETVTKQEQ